MNVKIIGMDHLGNGIGKIDDKVVFVPKSVYDDVVDVNVIKNYKKYDIARVEKIVSKSPVRVDVVCPYYESCGGCNISNMEYSDQLKFKTDKVKSIFKRYLDMEIDANIIPSEDIYKYRNKITYHCDNEIGLVGEFGGIVKVTSCLLVSDRVNELYQEIKKMDLSGVEKIVIKECDNGLILSVFGKMDVNSLKEYLVAIYINGECVYEKEKGYIMIGNLKFMVSDKSFFQVNTRNIANLYNEVVKYGEFKKNDSVIDLYCGVGSISLYIAKYVKKVIGIEIVEDAIRDANNNKKINGINNVEFLCSDAGKVKLDTFECDKLIVDPPRVGLSKSALEMINNKKIEKIIYVSCDPMTLVRDLKRMDNYKLEKISLVDMFPQTHHVECVAVLQLKEGM